MNATLIVGLISATTAVVLAMAGYTLNRRRDRELEWRKLKLERYQEFIASLSGIVGRRSTDEGQARYADAFNSLILVAPAPVLKALQAFNNEQRIDNPGRTAAAYGKLQNELLQQLRRDIHPDLADQSFEFFLIDSEPAKIEEPTQAALKLVSAPRA